MAPHHMSHLRTHLSTSNELQSGSPLWEPSSKTLCAFRTFFSTFDLCHVSNNVMLFHAYFCACIDIVNLIGGSLTGELILKLPNSEKF